MDHTELTRRYVEIGMGVAVTVSQEFDPSYGDQNVIGVVGLSHLFPPVAIGVATVSGRHLSRGAREFIEALQMAAENAQVQPEISC
jgi:DNA-binding transcriptional LysR family regulator